MLDFRLKTFMQVCEDMNFTRASEKLGLTQPAVTQQIHFLEDHYGEKLFNYKGKKLTLTGAGKVLLEASYSLYNDEKVLKSKIREASGGKTSLNFGVTRTIGDYCICESLAEYIKENSGTDIKMLVENTEVLLDKMHRGEISFAIVEGYYDKESFDSIIFDNVRFVAVASSKHKFGKKVKKLDDLLDENLIIREEGSGTRAIFERHIAKENMSISDFRSNMEIGGINAILQLLEMDMGISFMYYPAAEKQIKNGILQEIELTDFNVKHKFSFIWERGSIYSSEYEKICKKLAR